MFLICNLAVSFMHSALGTKNHHDSNEPDMIYFSCTKIDEYMDNSISKTIILIMVINTSAKRTANYFFSILQVKT